MGGLRIILVWVLGRNCSKHTIQQEKSASCDWREKAKFMSQKLAFK